MYPVRCFTCGKVVRGERYLEYRAQLLSPPEALEKVGAVRRCCRRMYISQPSVEIDKLAEFDRSSKRRRVVSTKPIDPPK